MIRSRLEVAEESRSKEEAKMKNVSASGRRKEVGESREQEGEEGEIELTSVSTREVNEAADSFLSEVGLSRIMVLEERYE